MKTPDENFPVGSLLHYLEHNTQRCEASSFPVLCTLSTCVTKEGKRRVDVGTNYPSHNGPTTGRRRRPRYSTETKFIGVTASLLRAGQTQLVVRRVNRPLALGTQQLQWQWNGAERGAPIVALFDNAATRGAIVAAASRAPLYCRRAALLYKYGDNTGGGGGG